MPLDTLETSLDLDWSSYDSWLCRLDNSLAVNAGFLVGHSAIRRVIMGESAVGSEASTSQLEKMVQLLHESLAAGAIGFSSTRASSHTDHHGDPSHPVTPRMKNSSHYASPYEIMLAPRLNTFPRLSPLSPMSMGYWLVECLPQQTGRLIGIC